MAEQPIKKEDIIQGEEIKKVLTEIIALLDQGLKTAMENNVKAAQELSKALQGVSVSTDAGKKATSEAGEKTTKLTLEQKELVRISQELEKVQMKANLLQNENVQGKIREVAETKKANQEKQKEITQGKAAADSYSAMVKKLRELREAWRLASEEGRKGLTPQIQKLDGDLKKLDKSVGQHQRNVGNYGSALAGVGKQLLGAVGLVGGLNIAIKGLGAIMNSAQVVSDKFAMGIEGAKFGFDAFARSIATMDFSNFFTNITDAVKMGIEYAKLLDELADRRNAVAIREAEARIETAALMKTVRDMTKTETERLEAADKILAKEDELAAARVENAKMLFERESYNAAQKAKADQEALKEFIRTYDQTVKQREAGQALIDTEKKLADAVKLRNRTAGSSSELMRFLILEIEGYQLAINGATEEQIIWADKIKSFNRLSDQQAGDIDKLKNAWIEYSNELAAFDEKTGELESRRSALMEKQVNEEGRVTIELNKEQEARTRAVEQQAEARTKALDKSMQDQAASATAQIADAKNVSAEMVEIKRQEIEQTQAMIDANADFEKRTRREILADQLEKAAEAAEGIGAMTDQLSSILADQKERELSAAGDNAQKREEIERKYFKKEQALAIARAIIDGALAIQKLTAQTGIFATLLIPLVAINTAAQVALIASQKFAEGGFTGKGTYRDETGERVAGIVHEDEFVINKRNTRKYRPLIEAIHEDDPTKIVQLVENGHFHELWGGMNYILKTVEKQDPYTRMMYDLLKSQPHSYVDSDGNTVIERSGRKQVIRRN